MSNIKKDLKLAREAIAAKDFENAVRCCQRVLNWEPDNYNARVFLGVAYLNLNKPEESEASYKRAIDINPTQILAWQGLASFYEKRERWKEFVDTHEALIKRFYIESNDGKKILDSLNKILDVQRKWGDTRIVIQHLERYLPEGEFGHIIKEGVEGWPLPVDLWREIVSLQESYDTETIKREISARKGRIGAPSFNILTKQVTSEVYGQSKLDEGYQKLIEYGKSMGTIDVASLEAKYLEFLQIKIKTINDKTTLLEKIFSLARSLVEQDMDVPVAYELLIENTNAQTPDQYDKDLLSKLSSKYPDRGLSKIHKGYRKFIEGGALDEVLDLYTEGFDKAPDSLYGYLTLSWLYHDSKDFETSLEYATRGKELVTENMKEYGRLLDKLMLSMEVCIANCYLRMSDKYQETSFRLYKQILAKDPDNCRALLGVGIILSERHSFDEAAQVFEKIIKYEPKNHEAFAELGWVYGRQHEYKRATEKITQAIELDSSNALYHYRLGMVYWWMDDTYRTDRSYSYNHLMQTVKLDPFFASAFTQLGHFYRLVDSDRARAIKCYEKSISLDPTESEAAQWLCGYYLEDDKHAMAEAVLRSVTSTNARAAWAWKRLGFIEMINENFPDAIVALQTSLRTENKDVQCWEGLGESYLHEGRYTAAFKAYSRAIQLSPDSTIAHCQIGYIKYKLGAFKEAIHYYKLALDKASELSQNKPSAFDVEALALKGLADSYIASAKLHFQMGCYGWTARELSNAMKTAVKALRLNPDLNCLWKIVGDICVTFRLVPTYMKLCNMEILVDILELVQSHRPKNDLEEFLKSDGQKTIDSILNNFAVGTLTETELLEKVLAIGCIAYECAIAVFISETTLSSSFCDLATVYYYLYEHRVYYHIEASSLLISAMRYVSISLQLNPTSPESWNILGVISLAHNPKIAQHAFIKVIEYNSRDPAPWCNLGLLYLLASELELANRAFQVALSLDPDCVHAWVGRAFVADLSDMAEAYNYFEQAFEMSSGALIEANYGFARTTYRKFIKGMGLDARGALASPAFALQKYIEQRPNDPCAWNLLGVVLEHIGEHARASQAFAECVRVLESTPEIQTNAVAQRQLALARTNLGRALCAVGGENEIAWSIEAYASSLQNIAIEPMDAQRVYAFLGAGIAYYFGNQLEQSLEMFEAALAATDPEEGMGGEGIAEVRKDVAVLLAQTLWSIGGEEARERAKEELFNCISQYPAHLPAIFCLCAMGLSQGDMELATAALRELLNLPPETLNDQKHQKHMSLLLLRYYELQGSIEGATLILLKLLKQRPANPEIWSLLAQHLLSHSQSPTLTRSIAETAIDLISLSHKEVNIETRARTYQNLALVSIRENERARAIGYATRAVRVAPFRSEGWNVLNFVVGN
ncbi:uncharacterized protein VTP21DRAFT_7303 [Calcarisporiella thermophila]|uniref:uncharacterized protein n=1 Tax=Calcarisporiella thermophila TaxID=911321 RepID=UPI0037424454